MLATAAAPTATAAPLIWALPTFDERFGQAVDDVAILGSGVLMFAGGTLLAIDLAAPMRPILWDGDSTPSPHLGMAVAGDRRAAPALRALALAAEDLRDRLAQWGWAGMAPSCLAVTDGIGVALVAGGTGDRSLDRLASDAFVIKAFDDTGLWRLVDADDWDDAAPM